MHHIRCARRPTRRSRFGGRVCGQRLASASSQRDLVLAAQAGDYAARDSLIETFLPLISTVARIYRGSAGVDRGELIQEGVVGVLRALRRYDPSLGTPFWAYASWWVRQAMQQLVSELGRPVVLSDRALRQLARIRDARSEHLQRCGRDPSCHELAGHTGLLTSQVESLIVAERCPRGLDEPVRREGDVSSSLGDLLVDPQAEEQYDKVSRRSQVEALPEVLGELDERERTIVSGRFGLDGPEQTLRELADAFGISAERIRQVEKGALEKLRTAMDRPA
ncbi:MAG TPA: sigma-70 family RNA polymerase sigma factor [Solirubrobacter sp.]|nr:sigma-70 family RNA polymerase sigma factor [Solirubrobacter sp.]